MPSGDFGWLGRGLSPGVLLGRGLFDSGVWLCGVFGSVGSVLVALFDFLACFVFVAGFAECLEVVWVVCASLGDVGDVVYF